MTKQTKKPAHPGVVIRNLLIAKGFCYTRGKIKTLCHEIAANYLGIPECILEELIQGKIPINYTTAHKLTKKIEGTDIRFWIDLQKEYDEWEACQVDKNQPEEKESGPYTNLYEEFKKAVNNINKMINDGLKSGCIGWRMKEDGKILFEFITGSK